MEIDLEMEDEFFAESGGEQHEFDLDLLLSVAGGLGRSQVTGSGKRVYEKDPDSCLKDLQRFLRRDDPDTRDAFFKLGELQAATSHLVPLLVTYPHDHELVLNTLKVLTFLTMPVDGYTEDPALQLQYLRDVKEAALQRDALAAIVGLSAGPLSRHPRMSDDDHMTVQLVITFVRNLLAIPDPPFSQARSGGRRSKMQEELLLLLAEESALELVALAAGHASERPFKSDAPLLLDTLYEVFKGVDAAEVAAAREPTPAGPGDSGGGGGGPAPAAAAAPRQPRPKPAAPPVSMRHGRFKSTLVTRHADSARVTYERGRGGAAAAAAAAAVVPDAPRRALGPAALLQLRRYAETLLAGPYNVLMGALRTELEPGIGISRLEPPDFAKWMAVAAWAAAYVRAAQERELEARGGARPAPGAPSPFGCISATMGWETFALVHKIWVEQADIPPGRGGAKDFTLQHGATRALRELMGVLDLAEKAGTDADRHAADRLSRRLLHDDMKESGLLPVLARLIKKFSARHEPRGAAGVLAEALHLVLRLYDRLVAKEGGKFYVRKRRAGGGRRRKLADAIDLSPPPEDAPPGAAGAAVGKDAAGEGGRGEAREEGAAASERGAAAAGEEGARPPAAPEGPVDSGEALAPKPLEALAAVAGEAPLEAAAAADGGAQAPAAAAPASGEEQPLADGAREAAGGGAPAGEGAGSRGGSAEPQAPPGGGAGGAGSGLRGGSEEPAASAAAGHKGDGEGEEGEELAPLAALRGGGGGGDAGRERAPLEELEEEYESEEEGGSYAEVALDLKKRARQELAAPAVGYASANGPALNHALCSFLWRLVLPEHLGLEPMLYQHLGLEPMLYQLSALRLFHRALSDPALRGRPDARELLLLATRVTRGLFARLAPADPAPAAGGAAGAPDAARRLAFGGGGEGGGGEGAAERAAREQAEREGRAKEVSAKMLFVELLFFKNHRDAEAISNNYDLANGLLVQDAITAAMCGGGRGRGRAGAGAAGDGWGGDEEFGAGRGFGDGGGSGADSDGRRAAMRTAAQAGLKQRRAPPPLLSAAGEARLKAEFEKLCADRANLEPLAAALGGKLSAKQVSRELRRLGLKFGSLPPWLAPRLAELWAGARGQGAKGGDLEAIRKLLREHGLQGGGAAPRRRARGGGASSDDGWASEVEGADPLLEVEGGLVEDLYARHLADDDYLEKIAADLPPALGATPASVLATLRFLGVDARPPPGMRRATRLPRARGGGGGGGRGRRGGDAGPAVSKALLSELWDRHRGGGDALNMVAMELGCGVMQVRKLMQKFGLGSDSSGGSGSGSGSDGGSSGGASGSGSDGGGSGGGGRRRGAGRAGGGGGGKRRVPVGRDQLQELHERFKAEPDYLDQIASHLPLPASDAQVAAWLRAHGIGATKEKRRAAAAPRPPRAGAGAAPLRLTQGGGGGGAAAAAGPAVGRVPEPRPAALLGFLEAVERAHVPGSSWLGAAAAVEWVLGKLKAAEEVWDALSGTGAALQDYALAPAGDADFNFFCTDWSNELLEAAGIRNDDGDFFKARSDLIDAAGCDSI
ncbi:MAG: timeless protein-domain-containing protein [Monoraphidium minutum]|nr:MAG: timeless protein-domain-containing protein [Monoraphidium minutum]